MTWLRRALVPALILTVAAPAAADWLVTRDGSAVETDGAWEVRGRQVVFHQADGRLVSMRLADIDLEASAARTAEAARPRTQARAAEEPRRAAVLVLTDADVKHARNRSADPEPKADAAEETVAEAAPAAEPARSVEVTGWRDQVNVDAGALEVLGSVANRGPSVVTDTRLEVRLLDDEGDLLERVSATLASRVLAPGASTEFKASFPGVPGYASVEFEARSRGFNVRPTATD